MVMIMYVGHQSGLVVWLPMYLQDFLGATPFLGSLSLSLLWVGIILGRLLCSRLTRYLQAEKIVIAGGLAGGLIIMAGFASQQPLWIVISTGLAGLASGAVIPLLVNIACDWFPHNSGTASAMIFLSGTLSTMVFPWLIGWTAELVSFQWAINITGVTLIAVFLLGLLLLRE